LEARICVGWVVLDWLSIWHKPWHSSTEFAMSILHQVRCQMIGKVKSLVLTQEKAMRRRHFENLQCTDYFRPFRRRACSGPLSRLWKSACTRFRLSSVGDLFGLGQHRPSHALSLYIDKEVLEREHVALRPIGRMGAQFSKAVHSMEYVCILSTIETIKVAFYACKSNFVRREIGRVRAVECMGKPEHLW
jgi:hypothetical protein